MAAISNYAGNALLNSFAGKSSSFGALASAPTIYLALCTVLPTAADTGSTITEATYTSYARKVTAASDWTAASGTGKSLANATVLSFPACTGSTSTVTHFALVDASSAGNLLAWGTLTSSLAVSNGITPSFAIAALTVSDS